VRLRDETKINNGASTRLALFVFFSLFRFPFFCLLSLIHFIIIIILIGDIFFFVFLKYFRLPYTYIYAYERERKKRKRRNRLYSFLSILLSVVVLCRSSILREIRFFYFLLFLLAIAWRWRPRSPGAPDSLDRYRNLMPIYLQYVLY
jgi:hypothetical protein